LTPGHNITRQSFFITDTSQNELNFLVNGKYF
jgi:hypothetical protein